MDEISYNTPIFKDNNKSFEYKKLSKNCLKNIGFSEIWNEKNNFLDSSI